MTAKVDIPGTSMSSLLQTSDDTPKDLSVELFLFLLSTVAKKIVGLMLMHFLYLPI